MRDRREQDAWARPRARRLELSAARRATRPAPDRRRGTGVAEFDRVLGGGAGARLRRYLLGGDPGIGKSTLLMQAAARVALQGRRAAGSIYVSGEEALGAVAHARSDGLGLVEGARQASPPRPICATYLTTLEAEKPSNW